MGELAQAMGLIQKMSTAILRYPSGRYGIVGSVPAELIIDGKDTMGLPLRKSMAWDTEEEAIDALLAIDITHFQMADCSWYDEK